MTPDAAETSNPTTAPFCEVSALEIAARVRSGRWSAMSVLEAYLARIDAINPRLNAIIWPTPDDARGAARAIDAARAAGQPLGPLAGVPLTVKDSFDVIHTAATLGIGRRKHRIASADGPIVERFRRAGALIVGKTNVPQIMLMYETDNRAFGRTIHPETSERGPGGSSGGESAAIAARLAALGLGSDLLGSLRQPAHACGVHTFKPSINRATTTGAVNTLGGMEAIVASPGPLARHMGDLIAALRVMLEEPFDDPFTTFVPWRDPAEVDVAALRVGVWDDDPMFRPCPAVRRALGEAADGLSRAGADVVPFAFPDAEQGFRLCLSLLAAANGDNIRHWLDGERPTAPVARMLRIWGMQSQVRAALCHTFDALGQPWRAKVVRWSRGAKTSEYWDLVHQRRTYCRRALAALRDQRIDVLLAPPHGLPALRHGTSSDTITSAVYTFVPSLLGVPCGTVAATRVRAGEESDRPATKEHVGKIARLVEHGSVGLPVGIQVIGLPNRDETALAAMQALERVFEGRPDYPPSSKRGLAAE
jgi:fatty acid amide hydrolase